MTPSRTVCFFKVAAAPTPGQPATTSFSYAYAETVVETASSVVCMNVQVAKPLFRNVDGAITFVSEPRQLGKLNFPRREFAVFRTEVSTPAWFKPSASNPA
jgi:hypothetical protein